MTDLLCGLFFGLGGAVCHKTDDKTDGGGADPAETEARKSMMLNIFHDLRSPLFAVSGGLETLESAPRVRSRS